MTGLLHDKIQHDPRQFLPWLVEMGADEILLDQPVARLNAVAATIVAETPATVQKPVLHERVMAQPKVNWQAVAAGAEGVALAEALAQNITSLESYREACQSFDAHPLRKTAHRTCTVSGAAGARILVVVDRPRNAEDAVGEVLAGNHEVLVNRMLAAIGLGTATNPAGGEQVGFASFIPWRPPGNRSVTELEARMCVPLFLKLLELMRPQLILGLGHLTGQWLAGGDEAVFKARGKWLSIQGVPLLTSFHPETLLVSPASKRLAWADLLVFRAAIAVLAAQKS